MAMPQVKISTYVPTPNYMYKYNDYFSYDFVIDVSFKKRIYQFIIDTRDMYYFSGTKFYYRKYNKKDIFNYRKVGMIKMYLEYRTFNNRLLTLELEEEINEIKPAFVVRESYLICA